MSRQKQFGKSTLVAAALALTFAGFTAISPVRALPITAQRFFSYMNAIDNSGQALSLSDKITYSLVLSGPNPKQIRPPRVTLGRL